MIPILLVLINSIYEPLEDLSGLVLYDDGSQVLYDDDSNVEYEIT